MYLRNKVTMHRSSQNNKGRILAIIDSYAQTQRQPVQQLQSSSRQGYTLPHVQLGVVETLCMVKVFALFCVCDLLPQNQP